MSEEQMTAPIGNTIVVLDAGSQVAKLLGDAARKLGVFSIILPCNAKIAEIKKYQPVGIIVSGGPASVYEKDSPTVDKEIFNLGLPVLGVCYGHQLMGHLLGGKVGKHEKAEYGRREVEVFNEEETPFEGIKGQITTWMSHGDQVIELPKGFSVTAKSPTCPIVAMADRKRKFFGIQFHPEVEHTEKGMEILRNFFFEICGAKGDWTMASFKDQAIATIRKQVGDGHVIGAVSGGVDSTTLAVLMEQAIGKKFTPIFIDTGLLRQNEKEEVVKALKAEGVNLQVVDASRKFLNKLEFITDPERKRRIIGKLFIEIFQKEARKIARKLKIKKIEFLAQGTLYPDVIESVAAQGGPTAKIKSHHNVGGLPKKMHLKLVEPFREIFKTEVRALAKELGLPKDIWGRHPFPGPGLAIRIIGRVTPDRLKILRAADAIWQEELRTSGWYDKVGQAFAVLPSDKSVGVMGDGRTYGHFIVLRSVDTSIYMTADVTEFPMEFIKKVTNRIVNEVRGVNRCVYDTTSKPPGTIEWE